MSKDEFNDAVDACSKLTAQVYSHNRKKDVEGISLGLIITLVLSSLLLISYFFLVYYGIRDKNLKLRIAGYFALGISVLVTSIIGILNCCQKPDKYTPFKDMVRKTLMSYFERLNRKWEARGIEWYVGDNHYWLEVRINKTKADAYRRLINFDIHDMRNYDENEENNKAPISGDGTDGNRGPIITTVPEGQAIFTGHRETDGPISKREIEPLNNKKESKKNK